MVAETENQTVKLNEVIAVRLESSRVLNSDGKFQQLEMVAPSSSFSVHVVKRLSKHRWRERKVTFTSPDSSVAQQWVDKIQEIISKPGSLDLLPYTCLVSRLLTVFAVPLNSYNLFCPFILSSRQGTVIAVLLYCFLSLEQLFLTCYINSQAKNSHSCVVLLSLKPRTVIAVLLHYV